ELEAGLLGQRPDAEALLDGGEGGARGAEVALLEVEAAEVEAGLPAHGGVGRARGEGAEDALGGGVVAGDGAVEAGGGGEGGVGLGVVWVPPGEGAVAVERGLVARRGDALAGGVEGALALGLGPPLGEAGAAEQRQRRQRPVGV